MHQSPDMPDACDIKLTHTLIYCKNFPPVMSLRCPNKFRPIGEAGGPYP